MLLSDSSFPCDCSLKLRVEQCPSDDSTLDRHLVHVVCQCDPVSSVARFRRCENCLRTILTKPNEILNGISYDVIGALLTLDLICIPTNYFLLVSGRKKYGVTMKQGKLQYLWKCARMKV